MMHETETPTEARLPQDEPAWHAAPDLGAPMPVVEAASGQDSAEPDARFNPMFGLLVKDDRDLTGLLAYSLYKLSKRDWLAAFARAQRRQPDKAEIEAFILGEETPRRVAAYRSQAEAALAGRATGVERIGDVSAPTDERPKMATILGQLTRPPGVTPPAAGRMRMPDGRIAPQPSLKLLIRYLLILGGLVACLAILVNYAKSTVFLN